MPRYAITEKAGRFVAGHTNTGVSTVLDLTERAAAYDVALGTLVCLDRPAERPEEADKAPAAPEVAPKAEAAPAPAAAPKRRGRKPAAG